MKKDMLAPLRWLRGLSRATKLLRPNLHHDHLARGASQSEHLR
jgi:hypothetical protein